MTGKLSYMMVETYPVRSVQRSLHNALDIDKAAPGLT